MRVSDRLATRFERLSARVLSASGEIGAASRASESWLPEKVACSRLPFGVFMVLSSCRDGGLSWTRAAQPRMVCL